MSKPFWGTWKDATLTVSLCAGFLWLASVRTAGADSEPASVAPIAPAAECVCREPENGARPGESLEARAERLERAWRLTRAEVRVNNTRKVRK
jgi:hypothetical protein